MTNNLSDYQKQMFYDIYKTTLSAIIAASITSRNLHHPSSKMIKDAAWAALMSVDLLTDETGTLCKPSDIINNVENNRRSIDSVSPYPEIED